MLAASQREALTDSLTGLGNRRALGEQLELAVAAPLLERAAAALTATGDGFRVQASRGVVALPHDASSAAAALRLADRRMYADKGRTDGSPALQIRDVLLRAMAEREPDLHEHIVAVALLAREVGAVLGLDAADCESVAHAAELHDVGKVAIPDTILRKPGPLDPAEAEFMRRHSEIGEAIVRAAPALGAAAALVRASHERWDGDGYPDGLSGEAIPLGARIVAVCDAYSAMRQSRPYGEVLNDTEALAELQRCAGSQFDPRVVEAFCSRR